ncbi:MAG: hypothetical protein RI554_01940 [Trueperaceae bacterium]|nr:hypothetical protein [Trueperaceae bacterium]
MAALLARLATRNGDAEAAATLLAVASPRLAGGVGGEAGLARLFATPLWAPWRRAAPVRIAPGDVIEDAARVEVTLAGDADARVDYLVSLRRDATQPDGWRVTGIAPAARPDL